MPFVLDYDSQGNVTGGHFVEVLPDRHLQLEPNKTDMARHSTAPGSSGGWPPGHFPYAQQSTNAAQPNPLLMGNAPPQGLLGAPPTAPAAMRQQSRPLNPSLRPNQAHRHSNRPPTTNFHAHSLPPTSVWQPTHNALQPRSQNRHPSSSSSSSYKPPSLITASQVNGDETHAVAPETPRFGSFTTIFTNISMTDAELAESDPTAAPATPQSAEIAIDRLSKPWQYVSDFAVHFKDNAEAFASFQDLCAKYNQKDSDEVDFYVGVYRILLQTDSLHLLKGFKEFLPPKWKDADLYWLDIAIEAEVQKELREVDKENAEVSKRVSKKKPPVNGFKTANHPDSSPLRAALVKLPINLLSPSTPKSASEQTPGLPLPSTPSPSSGGVPQDRPGLVKLPLKSPTTATPPPAAPNGGSSKRKRQTTPKKAIPAKRAAPATSADKPPNIKGKIRYTTLLGSEVPHVGPVYPSRRAVLARPGKPYIHAACGQGFTHPQDVKSHERKLAGGKGCRAEGKEWDDHPSCKVDYPQLKYVQVKDGYVILDQESYDKIEVAIAAGLRHHEMEKGAEKMDVDDEGKSEDDDEDADAEFEEDTEMVDAVDEEEADARAAALGLRKRSRRAL